MVKSNSEDMHLYELLASEFENNLIRSFKLTKTINNDFQSYLNKYEELAQKIRGRNLFLELQAQLNLPEFDPLEIGFTLFPVYDEDSILHLLNDPEFMQDEILKTFALFSYKFFNLYNINVTQ